MTAERTPSRPASIAMVKVVAPKQWAMTCTVDERGDAAHLGEGRRIVLQRHVVGVPQLVCIRQVDAGAVVEQPAVVPGRHQILE